MLKKPNYTCIAVVLTGLTLTAGCASTAQQARFNGPGAELAQRWSQAAGKPIDVPDAAPEDDPKLLPMTHFSAGSLFEKQGHWAQAIEQYKKAIALNDRFGGAYSRLGLCYIQTGQFEMAVQVLKKAVALQPDSPHVWNNLGFACLALKDYDQAEQCLGKALMLRGDFQRARLNLAILLVQQSRDAEALGHLRAALPDAFARYNLGTMQLAADRPADARDSFQQALHFQEEFPAAREGLDQALARLTQEPAAPPATDPVAAAPVKPGALARVEPDPRTLLDADAPADLTVRAEDAAADANLAAAPSTRPAASVNGQTALAHAGQVDISDTSKDARAIASDADTHAGTVNEPARNVATPRWSRVDLDPTQATAWLARESFRMNPPLCGGLDLSTAAPAASDVQDEQVSAPLAVASPGFDPLRPVTPAVPQPVAVAAAPDLQATEATSRACADLLSDDPDLAAIRLAIVTYLTLPAAQTPASVADLDLMSLRWASWTEGMAALSADITHMHGRALNNLMAKWLRVINELKTVTETPYYGMTAWAD